MYTGRGIRTRALCFSHHCIGQRAVSYAAELTWSASDENRMRAIHWLLITSMLPVLGYGQEATGNLQDSSCDTRTVLVLVLNAKRQTLSNLKAENFAAEAKGKPLAVLSVLPNTVPHRLVVLLDTSGSMRDERLANAQQLAIALASSTDSRTEIRAYAFGETVEYLGSSNDYPDLMKNLHVLRAAKSRTAIRDAVFKVMSELKNPGPEDMIYVISDGGDNRSETSQLNLTRALRASGLRLSAAVFPPPWPPMAEDRDGMLALEDLASRTGGFFTTLNSWNSRKPGQDSINNIELLARLTKHYYKVTVRASEIEGSSRQWKLRLQNLPVDIKGFRVLYPGELVPCSK
jgi:von Willebrand factor type A domain